MEKRLPPASANESSIKTKAVNEVNQTPKYLTDTKGKVRRRNSTLVSHDFGDDIKSVLESVDQLSNQVSA